MKGFGVWEAGQAVEALDGAPDAEVAHGQHVHPAQVEYEEHNSTPLHNALDRDEP